MASEKRTRWADELVTEVIEIPRWDEEMKSVLFYNKMDYHEFQEAEQRRYDKMMMKQIQAMVQDAMAPQIQEAMDRGATPEELEAMMPQTTEEIFALLGGIPTPSIPPPPKAIPTETIHKALPAEPGLETLPLAESETETNMLPYLVSEMTTPEQPLPEITATSKPILPEEDLESYTDDDIYALLGVEADRGGGKEQEHPQIKKKNAGGSTINRTASDEYVGPTSSDDYRIDETAEVDDLVGKEKPKPKLNVSDSSLEIEQEMTEEPKTVTSHPSLEESTTSIHEELNEKFGTSISSDIQVEDLIPKGNNVASRDSSVAQQEQDDEPIMKYNLDEWVSSDEDEPLVTENDVCTEPEAEKDANLEAKLHAVLPKAFLCGPRNTRDSIAITKMKGGWTGIGYGDEDNKKDAIEPNEIEKGATNDSAKPAKESFSSTEKLWGKIVAKEDGRKSQNGFSSTLRDVPSDDALGGLDPETHTPTSPMGRRKVPVVTSGSPDSPERTRRKVPVKIAGLTPNPTSSPKARRKKRSKSVDIKGTEQSNGRERRAGRKHTATLKRSNSDHALAQDEERGEHDLVIVSGKRMDQKPTKSHSTRREKPKKAGQRTDYEVHGGWGNPLEFGAASKGASPKSRRKATGKKMVNTK